jgi:hypothetical protein
MGGLSRNVKERLQKGSSRNPQRQRSRGVTQGGRSGTHASAGAAGREASLSGLHNAARRMTEAVTLVQLGRQ